MKLVENCKDLYGELSESNQRHITRLLQNPSAENWEQARRIVVSPAPLLTLDMAVSRVTETKLNSFPDQFTIYRALDYAIKKHQHYLSRPMDMEFGIR
ncbi:MAG: hypothetical protein OEZ43_00780 [Gammaproteobacteria bacterium]|nr:hypothetical protein [Gammaproteobacteria bacterium]